MFTHISGAAEAGAACVEGGAGAPAGGETLVRVGRRVSMIPIGQSTHRLFLHNALKTTK